LAGVLLAVLLVSVQPQQTGVLLIVKQQVQPQSMQQVMQSQQDWIIWQQLVSPLVQVMQKPESVMSNRHRPMVKLQVQQVTPFTMQQQLHIPPDNMVQRFWTMLQAILSSQTQVSLNPPVHFSTLKVQRGTIIQLVPVGEPVGVPTVGVP
jgi:hypothetical protein